MSYQEIVTRALKGRTVNATAKQWGLPQATLDRYTKGQRLPDYTTAKKMADEAGVSYGEMFEILALEEEKRKGYNRAPSADVAQLVEQLIRNQ
ncbi:helix-turn-helix domain-containing protein [Herbaspirillum rubrisubalbicans]|uniref:helix-turn-helix domain-containing protein n=1 Tax=Herbaspirillum rubrisubalbicans TaxID=80842 RepID=UPI000DD4BEAB